MIGKLVLRLFPNSFRSTILQINFNNFQVDTYRQFTKLFNCTNVLHEDSFLRKHNP